MSGYRTHMLIGAVGGLGAYRVAERLVPSALAVRLTVGNASYAVPNTVVGLSCVIASAYLAWWPDIDEPGSHISRQIGHFMTWLGAIIGLLIGLTLNRSVILLVVGALCGAGVGRVGRYAFLRLLHTLSGGHRHLTHSLLLGTAMVIAGGVLYFTRLSGLTLPLLALAWGQFLHLAGDVITPGGVPLFYPIWRRDVHLLPHSVALVGEMLAGITTALLGLFLLSIQ